VLELMLGLRDRSLAYRRNALLIAAMISYWTREESAVADPIDTDPDKYAVVFENERVRVLEYRDGPGGKTSPHYHPDSVMVTLSGFERRLTAAGQTRDVRLAPGEVRWLDAQTHSGENIGSTATHVVFVELKGEVGVPSAAPTLGPSE
jgi:quercetin dioxygenase-like cupin family protein